MAGSLPGPRRPLARRGRGITCQPAAAATIAFGIGSERNHVRAGLGELLLGCLGLRPVISLQTAESSNLESVLFEYGRGTRGSASAVSSGEDGLVFRQLAETLLELRHRNVDRALVAAELLDLLRLADIQENGVAHGHD